MLTTHLRQDHSLRHEALCVSHTIVRDGHAGDL